MGLLIAIIIIIKNEYINYNINIVISIIIIMKLTIIITIVIKIIIIVLYFIIIILITIIIIIFIITIIITLIIIIITIIIIIIIIITVKHLIVNTPEMWTPPNVNTISRSHVYLLHCEKTSEMWTPPNVNAFALVPRCSHFRGFTVCTFFHTFCRVGENCVGQVEIHINLPYLAGVFRS